MKKCRVSVFFTPGKDFIHIVKGDRQAERCWVQYPVRFIFIDLLTAFS